MPKEKQKFEISKNPVWPPPKRIPRDQRWFWTERWQQMEREAQEDIDAGRVHSFDSAEEAIKWLNEHCDNEPSDIIRE